MPHKEYFKEILFMPDGRVLGDGRLIDRVKPSHNVKVTRSKIPGACVSHIVTL